MKEKRREEAERYDQLQHIAVRLQAPMAVLGLAWLVLLVIELVWGLSPALQLLSGLIWLVFILDFLLELTIAPHKGVYLKRNWLMVLALFVPALRILRFLQFFRVLQGARLVRVLSSLTRAMRALGASLGRHGFRYVLLLTLMVTFAGAAGMYAFERGNPGFTSYPAVLWWTAMIMATLGSADWPITPEGRMLCLLLSLYAFSVFGYVTAAIASFLVGRDTTQTHETSDTLRDEIVALREEVRKLSERLPKG